MTFLRKHSFLLLAGFLYCFLSLWFVWQGEAYYTLASVAFLAIYFAIYYTEKVFLALAFLTPLSVNIEEYTKSFGLFIPTEPLLFGLLILLIFKQMQSRIIPTYVWQHPLVRAAGFYLLWIAISSITSSDPLVSLKFLLAKLWFLVPLLFFAPLVYQKRQNILIFLWLFVIATGIVVSYTLVVHASYGFGEQEGHWVMWPFFKDHTIYGAAVAFVTPLVLGLYFSKKHSPIIQMMLLAIMLLILLGLYFSYTRAAWLSVIAALMVLLAIRLKIAFSYLLTVALLIASYVFFTWDSIQMEMARNKTEHTTEEFGERLQSATNVTTDASNLERLNRWSCALKMFQERPVFGFGPGTYAFEYARFQEPENLTIISTNFGDMGNAHSEYLGPMAEMGLPGLLTVLLLVGTVFYKGLQLYHSWPEEDKEMRVLLLAMIMALVTYFVHGFLNNFLDTDKAAVPIWSICAVFIAQEYVLKATEKSKVSDSGS